MVAALIVALAVAGIITLGGDRALAGGLRCGDTITTDTTLHRDLVNCRNNGIVIGADGVTLDLNGHRIDGDGKKFGDCPRNEFCDVGVLNDGHDGITMTNGSVREFAYGVFVGKARRNRVLDVSSSKNVLFGFVVALSSESVVRNSSASDNLAPKGDGMGMFDSHDNRILNSSFRDNPLGIHVADSDDNLFKGNVVSGNSGGIFVEGSDGNQVRGNRCVDNDVCLFLGPGNGNVIANNRVSGGLGGIFIENGRENVVSRNVVVDTRRDGIGLGIKRPSIGGGDNVVRRNRVRGAGSDAFSVNVEDGHSRLRENVAIGAAGDGFDVESRSTKLTGNRALRNDDLGIEAVDGVKDGGGNVARDNGDPRECINISCN